MNVIADAFRGSVAWRSRLVELKGVRRWSIASMRHYSTLSFRKSLEPVLKLEYLSCLNDVTTSVFRNVLPL